MDGLNEFLATYGYALIAGWTLIDQLGIPIPAIPILIVAGSMAGHGELHLGATLAAATLGSLPSDLFWYFAGRKRGRHGIGSFDRHLIGDLLHTRESLDRQ